MYSDNLKGFRRRCMIKKLEILMKQIEDVIEFAYEECMYDDEPPSEESGTPTPPESPSLFDKLKDAGKSLLGLDGEHFIDPKNNTNSRGAKNVDTMEISGPMEKGKLKNEELGDREDNGIGNVNVTNFTITGDVEASEKDLGTGKIRVSGDTIYQKGLSNALQVPYGGKYGNLNL